MTGSVQRSELRRREGSGALESARARARSSTSGERAATPGFRFFTTGRGGEGRKGDVARDAGYGRAPESRRGRGRSWSKVCWFSRTLEACWEVTRDGCRSGDLEKRRHFPWNLFRDYMTIRRFCHGTRRNPAWTSGAAGQHPNVPSVQRFASASGPRSPSRGRRACLAARMDPRPDPRRRSRWATAPPFGSRWCSPPLAARLVLLISPRPSGRLLPRSPGTPPGGGSRVPTAPRGSCVRGDHPVPFGATSWRAVHRRARPRRSPGHRRGRGMSRRRHGNALHVGHERPRPPERRLPGHRRRPPGPSPFRPSLVPSPRTRAAILPSVRVGVSVGGYPRRRRRRGAADMGPLAKRPTRSPHRPAGDEDARARRTGRRRERRRGERRGERRRARVRSATRSGPGPDVLGGNADPARATSTNPTLEFVFAVSASAVRARRWWTPAGRRGVGGATRRINRRRLRVDGGERPKKVRRFARRRQGGLRRRRETSNALPRRTRKGVRRLL